MKDIKIIINKQHFGFVLIITNKFRFSYNLTIKFFLLTFSFVNSDFYKNVHFFKITIKKPKKLINFDDIFENIFWLNKEVIIKKPSFEGLKEAFAAKMQRLVDICTRRKVHYWHSSTDCDHFNRQGTCTFKNIFEAERGIEESYANAEGATSWRRMTKADFLECENETSETDYILEAYENGNSYKVRG